MNPIIFKAVVFVENNDALHGHYFYNLTLPEAIDRMKAKGIDPIGNIRMRISVYYW
jgi:hypothetical protein